MPGIWVWKFKQSEAGAFGVILNLRVFAGMIGIALGLLWISQGSGVFPVGPMANKIEYAWLGIVAVVAGIFGLFVGRR